MAAIVHSDKAKKAIKKIKEAMQDYPLGIEFGELMQKTGYAKSSLYSALSLVGAQKSDDGFWHLPGSQNFVSPVNETAEDDLDDNLDDLATAIDQPVKQDDGGNMQDNGGNMQDAPVNIEDEELNTQAPHVNYHDNESSSHDNSEGTLINPSAEIFNPSAGVVNPSVSKINLGDYSVDDDINTDSDHDWSKAPEWAQYWAKYKDGEAYWFDDLPRKQGDYWGGTCDFEKTTIYLNDKPWHESLERRHQPIINQSSNGQVTETAPVAESDEEFELQPPPIATKHYVLIENCTLSLSRDGTGQEPVLAKDFWVDDEGIELEDSDCLVMKRARMPFINEVEFRGVTYRNLLIVNNAQIFHGVFDSIKTAHDEMAKLTTKKRGNFFEVIEV